MSDPMGSGFHAFSPQPVALDDSARHAAHMAAQQIEFGNDPRYSVGAMIGFLGGRQDILYSMDAGQIALYINLLIIARRGTP